MSNPQITSEGFQAKAMAQLAVLAREEKCELETLDQRARWLGEAMGRLCAYREHRATKVAK